MVMLAILIFGVLSWVCFASVRFIRFKSKDLNNKVGDRSINPHMQEQTKVATTAYFNRVTNIVFLIVLAALLLFDPNLWPDSLCVYEFLILLLLKALETENNNNKNN